MQGERHAGIYVTKAENLNVESSYFLLVYIGISFLEPGVFIFTKKTYLHSKYQRLEKRFFTERTYGT